MLSGNQAGIGGEVGSLTKARHIHLSQEAAGGETADAWNGAKQFNLLGFVGVLGEQFVQLLFEQFDLWLLYTSRCV